METTHTKEAWQKSKLFKGMITDGSVYIGSFNTEEDVDRAVTCVNALKGVADPSKAIADAKDLLKQYAKEINTEKWQASNNENLPEFLRLGEKENKIKQVLASLGEEVEQHKEIKKSN